MYASPRSLSRCLSVPRLCPFPCVLWLLLIGLVLCNDGKRSVLGLLPRVHTSNPNWLGAIEGYLFPGLCQAPLSCPTC